MATKQEGWTAKLGEHQFLFMIHPLSPTAPKQTAKAAEKPTFEVKLTQWSSSIYCLVDCAEDSRRGQLFLPGQPETAVHDDNFDGDDDEDDDGGGKGDWALFRGAGGLRQTDWPQSLKGYLRKRRRRNCDAGPERSAALKRESRAAFSDDVAL